MSYHPELIFQTKTYERAIIERAGALLARAEIGDRGLGFEVRRAAAGDRQYAVTHVIGAVGLEMPGVEPGSQVRIGFTPEEWWAYQGSFYPDNAKPEASAYIPPRPGDVLSLSDKAETSFDSFIEFCGRALEELEVDPESPYFSDRFEDDQETPDPQDYLQDVLEGDTAKRLIHADLNNLHGLHLAINAAACGILEREAALQTLLNTLERRNTMSPTQLALFKEFVGIVRKTRRQAPGSAIIMCLDAVDSIPNTANGHNLELAVCGFTAGILRADGESSVRFRDILVQAHPGDDPNFEELIPTLRPRLANRLPQVSGIASV